MDVTDAPIDVILAVSAALVVGLLAFRVGALTRSGTCAATATGSLIVLAAGWWTGALLVLFFVTSSLLSRLGSRRTTFVRQAKGSRRDGIQVLANGGIPLVCALLGWWTGDDIWILGSVVAIAAAAADTWATEIGRLTQATPRSILTFALVPVGTSGAVSLPGSAASAAAGLLIGGCTAFGIVNSWLHVGIGALPAMACMTLLAAAGSAIDSLLGASVQEKRRCLRCGDATESRHHTCGGETKVVGGIRGIDNDMVNLLSIALVSVMTVVIGMANG